jgi:hypothetical protein
MLSVIKRLWSVLTSVARCSLRVGRFSRWTTPDRVQHGRGGARWSEGQRASKAPCSPTKGRHRPIPQNGRHGAPPPAGGTPMPRLTAHYVPYDGRRGRRAMPLEAWQPGRTVVAGCVRVLRWVRRSRTQSSDRDFLRMAIWLCWMRLSHFSSVTSDRACGSCCSHLEIPDSMLIDELFTPTRKGPRERSTDPASGGCHARLPVYRPQ